MIPKTNYSASGNLKSDYLKGIGTITYYQKFLYLNIEEGTHLGFIEMEKIHSLASYHYKDQAYAYLCNKNVSYSMNPISYTILNKIDALKCIAIIKDLNSTHDIEVEKHFIKKPFKAFETFEKASEWLNSLF